MVVTRNTKIHEKYEDRHVAVVEKHTIDGANTITLMKYRHRYVVIAKVTRMDGAITVVKMLCCGNFEVNQFTKCMREWQAVKAHRLLWLGNSNYLTATLFA